MSSDGVAEKAIELEADHVIIVDRWHGGPGKINLFVVSSTGLKPVSPLMLLSAICLRRELKEGTRRVCSSVVTVAPEASSNLGKVAGCLSQFLGLPLQSFDEAAENHRVSMHFSFDSKRRSQFTFLLLGRMVEIGPRVTLSKVIWEVSS
ncbi:MAG: hypothetical protein NWF06_08725 [Candidatus Bathyarchaeota archaeon]|nr:hypothetical protein [Candidatus Bathyarchaeum sp.]